jgi:hypothetical protein
MNEEEKSVVVTSKMKQEKVANLETLYVEPLKQPSIRYSSKQTGEWKPPLSSRDLQSSQHT